MALKKGDLLKMWEEKSMFLQETFKKSILVPTGRGFVYAARDYERALCLIAELGKVEAYLPDLKTKEEAYRLLHPAVVFRLKVDTPCLAFRYDELKPEEQEKLFTNKSWVFYEKENGVRGWLIVYKGKGFLFSRNISDKDCGLLEYWSNINQDLSSFDKDDIYAVDVEIKYEPDANLLSDLKEYGIETESKLEAVSSLLQMRSATAREIQEKYKAKSGKDLVVFRMIHPLYFKGKNFLKHKLREGIYAYKDVADYGKERGLNVQKIKRYKGSKEGKEAFLDSILQSGGEGIVAHNEEAEYHASENRDRRTWVKLKRSVAASAKKEGMGDTIDAFISGFKMSKEDAGNAGLIGSFELSCYIRRPDGSCYTHVIAYVPNIEQKTREEATVIVDGVPTLADDFYNLVVEVDGQAISAVSRRLTHPRMLRFRFDKTKEECVYSEEFIKSQMV